MSRLYIEIYDWIFSALQATFGDVNAAIDRLLQQRWHEFHIDIRIIKKMDGETNWKDTILHVDIFVAFNGESSKTSNHIDIVFHHVNPGLAVNCAELSSSQLLMYVRLVYFISVWQDSDDDCTLKF